MPRPILEETRIHPAIREKISALHADIVREVQDAAAANAWAADTLGYRQYVASTNDTTYRTSAQPGEQILVVMSRADGRYWYEIPLADRQGRWFTSDYTWLRVRVLYVYNSIGNRHPIGGPPVQQFRCDLVGRR